MRREADIVTKKSLSSCTAVVGLVVSLAAWPATRPYAQQSPPVAVQIDSDDIGGGVASKKGPEARGWGDAETAQVGTRVAKNAGTKDRGGDAIPHPPHATYNQWGRGYRP